MNWLNCSAELFTAYNAQKMQVKFCTAENWVSTFLFVQKKRLYKVLTIIRTVQNCEVNFTALVRKRLKFETCFQNVLLKFWPVILLEDVVKNLLTQNQCSQILVKDMEACVAERKIINCKRGL